MNWGTPSCAEAYKATKEEIDFHAQHIRAQQGHLIFAYDELL